MHWNKLLTLLAIGLIPITAKSQVVQSSTEGKQSLFLIGSCKYKPVQHTHVAKQNLET